MPNSFYCATVSQAEIDQHSREARLRLEYLETLLVPGVRLSRPRTRLFIWRILKFCLVS